MKPLLHSSLQFRLMLIMAVTGILQVGGIGLISLDFVGDAVEEQIGKRALQSAMTIAQMPQIILGITRDDSAGIQELVERLRKQNGATFIVVGDSRGVRIAHPIAERIGKPMVGGDSLRALQNGESYISKAHGSLGLSIRGKSPVIFNGQVIGIVSVGYLASEVDGRVDIYHRNLGSLIALVLTLGIGLAALVAYYVKRAMHGLEPKEIALLFEERSATLQSVHEGIVALDREGCITTINRAAIKTLKLNGSPESLRKQRVQDILPDSNMMNVLDSGQAQYDFEFHYKGMSLIVNRIPITDGKGVHGVVSTFRHKDEISQLSQELSQVQAYAEMLRVQTHEYSNKLSTIAGQIQLGSYEQALTLISSETSGYQALIHFLIAAVPDPVISGLVLGKYNRSRELGLTLEIDRDSHMADIPEHISSAKLITLLGNLLDNAFEACLLNKDGNKEVKLSMTDLGKELIFEIEDSGLGVEDEDRASIFDKGVTSKLQSGHGFGLFMVKEIVDALGGQVVIENGEQGGCRFTLYLPKNSPQEPIRDAL